MLIRVLEGDGVDAAEPARIETITDDNGASPKTISLPKLCIHAKASDPKFKMLFVPYKTGQALPTTSWDSTKTVLKIEWPDQSDTVTFSPLAGGRTGFIIVRGGQTLVQMK